MAKQRKKRVYVYGFDCKGHSIYGSKGKPRKGNDDGLDIYGFEYMRPVSREDARDYIRHLSGEGEIVTVFELVPVDEYILGREGETGPEVSELTKI